MIRARSVGVIGLALVALAGCGQGTPPTEAEMEELVKRDHTFVNDQPTWDHVDCENTGWNQFGDEDYPVWFCTFWWDAANAKKMRDNFVDSKRKFSDCLVYQHGLQFASVPLSAPRRYATCRSAAAS